MWVNKTTLNNVYGIAIYLLYCLLVLFHAGNVQFILVILKHLFSFGDIRFFPTRKYLFKGDYKDTTNTSMSTVVISIVDF